MRHETRTSQREHIFPLHPAACLLLLGYLFCLFPGLSEACSVCYGNSDQLITRSMNAGVIVLAGIVIGVLTIIACTAFRWARRARELGPTA